MNAPTITSNLQTLLRNLAAMDPWRYIHDGHDSGDECFFCARRRNSGQHADYCIWARAQVALAHETCDEVVPTPPDQLEVLDAAVAWAYCPDAGGYRAADENDPAPAIEDTCERLNMAVRAMTGKNIESPPFPNHWTFREMRIAVTGSEEKASAPLNNSSILDRKVTVCSACLCASCWQGDFYCQSAKTAATVEKTVRELFQGNVREDSGYWFKDLNTGEVDWDAKAAAKRAWLQENRQP